MEKITYTAFSIDNNPIDQPTPKLVWGQWVRDTTLEVGDEVIHSNKSKGVFSVKEIKEDTLILTNSNGDKDFTVSKVAPLFKVHSEIPNQHQKLFFDGLKVEGTRIDGNFLPDEKYFINYLELFRKYFDLIRKTLYDDRVQYQLTFTYMSIFDKLGVGSFNEYIRNNFIDHKGETIEDSFQSAYEYGMEFYNGDRFVVTMLNHVSSLDRQGLFEQGVRAIVFNEGIKINFSKL